MRAIAQVRCYQGDTLLKTCDFPIPATLNDAAVALPSRDSLVAQAKDALAIERLAFPPYAGIRFEVEYRR